MDNVKIKPGDKIKHNGRISTITQKTVYLIGHTQYSEDYILKCISRGDWQLITQDPEQLDMLEVLNNKDK